MNRKPRIRVPQSDTGAALSPLLATGAVIPNRMRWILPLLLVIYILCAALHALLVPTGQTGYQNAPDEAAHVNFVRILATGRLPTLRDAEQDPLQQSYEWHQPPLYYAVATTLLWTGPKGLRIVSIVCGVAAIYLIYLAAMLLFPADRGIATLAAGIAALVPGHIANTSTVCNDALLEVCCSAALVALIIAFRNGFSLWRAGWLGVALGSAMLTKATGLLLIPVVLLAFPLLQRSGEKPVALLQGYAWCFAVASAICGWWYLRNALVFHEVLPLRAFEASFRGTLQASDVARRYGWNAYWTDVVTHTYQSFWAVYGTPLTATVGKGQPRFLADAVYQIMGIVCCGVAVGMVRLHLWRRDMTATQQYVIWILFAHLGLVSLAFLSFLTHYYQTQGRYLYPAMLPICLVMALGWRALFPQRYRELATGLLLTLLGLFAVLFLSTVQAAVS